MTHEEFLDRVRRAGAPGRGEAARATDAVLRELAASLTWGETRRISSYLPRRLGRAMVESSFQSSMSRLAPEVFVAHVAAREEVDRATAAAHVRAVLETLLEALPPAVAAGLVAQLPRLFRAGVPGGAEPAGAHA